MAVECVETQEWIEEEVTKPVEEWEYIHLTERMITYGANLGMPHTKAMKEGLFELRMKSKEGISRVLYCTLINKRIVMLHSFRKKTQKTPPKDLKLAISRMKEVKSNANT
jgi:phage-related protein